MGWSQSHTYRVARPDFLFFFAQRHRRRLPTTIHPLPTFLLSTHVSFCNQPFSCVYSSIASAYYVYLPTYSTSLPPPTALHTLPRYFFSFEIFLYPLKRRLHNSKRFKVRIGFIHRYDHFRLLSFLCILLSFITLFLSISHLLPSPPTPHPHPPFLYRYILKGILTVCCFF